MLVVHQPSLFELSHVFLTFEKHQGKSSEIQDKLGKFHELLHAIEAKIASIVICILAIIHNPCLLETNAMSPLRIVPPMGGTVCKTALIRFGIPQL